MLFIRNVCLIENKYIFNTLLDTGFCPRRVYTTNLVVDISNCHPFLMSDIVQEGKFVKI